MGQIIIEVKDNNGYAKKEVATKVPWFLDGPSTAIIGDQYTGRLLDSAGGNPLSGKTIAVNGVDTTTTGPDGTFSFVVPGGS